MYLRRLNSGHARPLLTEVGQTASLKPLVSVTPASPRRCLPAHVSRFHGVGVSRDLSQMRPVEPLAPSMVVRPSQKLPGCYTLFLF